jgi:hypothetical protein
LCGSRVAQTATRCLVCGTDLDRAVGRLSRAPRRLYPSPIILGLLVVLMGLGLLLTLGTGTVPMPQRDEPVRHAHPHAYFTLPNPGHGHPNITPGPTTQSRLRYTVQTATVPAGALL